MVITKGHFSALAGQDCQCYVDEWLWGVQDDAASTKACCDQWEDAHASGVKYSGTWNDLVRACLFVNLDAIELLTPLAVQGPQWCHQRLQLG